jgi:hypothetical protein
MPIEKFRLDFNMISIKNEAVDDIFRKAALLKPSFMRATHRSTPAVQRKKSIVVSHLHPALHAFPGEAESRSGESAERF